MSKKRRGSTSLRFASKGVERKFRRQLRRRLTTLSALIEKHAARFLVETRTDARRVDQESFSVALRGLWVRFGGQPESEATSVVESTDRSVSTTVRASVKQALPDARVLPSSLDLSEEVSTITGRIKSLEDYYIERVGSELEKIAKSEASQQDLRDMLREQAGLADRKAELLARDVAGTLHAEIATKRAQEAGVRGYIWRTQRDERVRPEHEEREGERFTWDEPPEDGHPGEPPLCRCWAEPDIDSVLDMLDLDTESDPTAKYEKDYADWAAKVRDDPETEAAFQAWQGTDFKIMRMIDEGDMAGARSRVFGDDRLLAEAVERTRLVRKAVEEAPKYQGVTFRGLNNLPDDAFATMTTIGETITDKAMSSWTMDQEIASLISQPGKTDGLVLMTRQPVGVELAKGIPFSADEGEVLAPPTKMRVLSVEKRSFDNGRRSGVVTVVEVEQF